jgi:hypothetical protein
MKNSKKKMAADKKAKSRGRSTKKANEKNKEE